MILRHWIRKFTGQSGPRPDEGAPDLVLDPSAFSVVRDDPTISRPGILVDRTAPFTEWDHYGSWLGGRPLAPTDFQWPRSGNGTPLHFLAQIDCSELPALPEEANGLPRTGHLQFFAETNGWSHDDPSCSVRYLSPELIADAVLIAEPDDTPPIGTWPTTFKSTTEPGAEPRFRRWPVRFTLFETTREEGARNKAIARATSARLKDSIRDRLWPRPELTFDHPIVWDQVFIETSLLINDLPSIRERVRSYLKRRGEDDPGWKKWFSREESEIRDWFDRSVRVGRLTPVRAEDRQEYRRFMGGLPHHIASDASHLVFKALDATSWTLVTSGEEAHSLVPPELRDDIVSIEPGNTWGTAHVHQMFGWGREVQISLFETEDSVLLMQFDSDDRMGWCWGDVGVLKFWISPEDLLERRFDRVEMIVESG